jgi:hypothetical protein
VCVWGGGGGDTKNATWRRVDNESHLIGVERHGQQRILDLIHFVTECGRCDRCVVCVTVVVVPVVVKR